MLPSLFPDDFIVAPGRMVALTESGAGVGEPKKDQNRDSGHLRVCEVGVSGDHL